MTKIRVIRVFSFIMALTLVFAMFSAPSYAISPRQFGAWIASALTAINITATSTLGPALQYGNQINDYLSAPFKIESSQMVDVPYTYSNADIEEYLQQSTISFTGDDVVIDGKHYQDVWLSNEAAEKFRVNAFDIQSAWNIASNTEGTYVSGEGIFDGAPVYNVYNVLRTQSTNCPGSLGNVVFTVSPTTGGYYNKYVTCSDGIMRQGGSSQMPPLTAFIYKNGSQPWYAQFVATSGAPLYAISPGLDSNLYTAEPFDFDWVSSEIPSDVPLESDEGLHMYVPTDPNEWQDSPETQTIINNYNTYLNNNPDITPDVDLDLDTPGLLDKVGDLLDILGPIVDLLKPSFGPKDEDPDPPVPPVPGDTISETPWSSLVEWLQRIFNILDDILGIRDVLQNFKSAFDSAISTIENVLSNIKSVLDSILSSIQNLISSFQTILSSIKSVLDSILDALSDLADSIVSGNTDWFSDVVDAIKAPFLRWFGILKAATGIWRYVVQWVQNISAPFGYFFNILANINSTFVSPLYAVAAAAIVIAIYRRFGR